MRSALRILSYSRAVRGGSVKFGVLPRTLTDIIHEKERAEESIWIARMEKEQMERDKRKAQLEQDRQKLKAQWTEELEKISKTKDDILKKISVAEQVEKAPNPDERDRKLYDFQQLLNEEKRKRGK